MLLPLLKTEAKPSWFLLPCLIILVEYKCVVGVHNLWAHISQLGPSVRHFSAPK